MTRRSLAQPDDLLKAAHEFLFYRDTEARAKPVKEKARDLIKSWLTRTNDAGKFINGREDENGHRFYDFDEPLTINGETYTGIQAQRKLPAPVIDLEAAEALAKAKGVYDLVFPEKTVRVFDEDALFREHQLGIFTDQELDDLEVTGDPTYSLTAVKA